MRRHIFITVLVALACAVLLCGCGLWMNGERVSVTPHEERFLQDTAEVIEVSTYSQMRNALTDMVEIGAESGMVSISSSNNVMVHFYANTAVEHVMNNTPVGAYAVKDISYEIGTNRGASVVAFKIAYQRSRIEVLRMQQVSSMEDGWETITAALDNCDASVAVRISQYEQADLVQMVQDYANEHPDLVMEMPQVGVFLYPETGKDRIVELTFTYQTSRETLRQMQEQVAQVFTSAELYVKKTTQVLDIYSKLYAFLMERDDYTVETSITPGYSLLHHGVGDSRAFANVYARMCRQAELNCQVVSGTRDGQPWCWNIVRYRGEYYHVDLLRCSENSGFQMHKAEEMPGYVWDYSAYDAN